MTGDLSNGHIKLYRCLLDSDLMRDARRIKALKLFVWSLLRASWKARTVKWGGISVEVGPGQFITGVRTASRETGLSEREIRTAFSYLEATQRTTHQSTHLYSVITIVNWESYQSCFCGSDTENDTELDYKQEEKKNKSCSHAREETKSISSDMSGSSGAHAEKNSAAGVGGNGFVVPSELVGLELYEVDRRLCERFPSAVVAWSKAYPGVDIVAEVRRAHAWEVSNPGKRKKQRVRFLDGWLGRERRRVDSAPEEWDPYAGVEVD